MLLFIHLYIFLACLWIEHLYLVARHSLNLVPPLIPFHHSLLSLFPLPALPRPAAPLLLSPVTPSFTSHSHVFTPLSLFSLSLHLPFFQVSLYILFWSGFSVVSTGRPLLLCPHFFPSLLPPFLPFIFLFISPTLPSFLVCALPFALLSFSVLLFSVFLHILRIFQSPLYCLLRISCPLSCFLLFLFFTESSFCLSIYRSTLKSFLYTYLSL